jgi:hypothetical protein
MINMPKWVKGDKNEELWAKAQTIVKNEYSLTEKDGDKFWKLVVGVYKKSGGEVVKTYEGFKARVSNILDSLNEARDYGYKGKLFMDEYIKGVMEVDGKKYFVKYDEYTHYNLVDADGIPVKGGEPKGRDISLKSKKSAKDLKDMVNKLISRGGTLKLYEGVSVDEAKTKVIKKEVDYIKKQHKAGDRYVDFMFKDLKKKNPKMSDDEIYQVIYNSDLD